MKTHIGSASRTLPVHSFLEFLGSTNHPFLILFRLDLYEGPILQGLWKAPRTFVSGVYEVPKLWSRGEGAGEGGRVEKQMYGSV